MRIYPWKKAGRSQLANCEAQEAGAVNPMKQLEACGQSGWLDYLRHSLIESGEWRALIERHGLKRVTSNHSIFENAIRETDDNEGRYICHRVVRRFNPWRRVYATSPKGRIRRVDRGCDLEDEYQRCTRESGRVAGTGPWSAAVVLLRGFGRIGVFASGDVGAIRGLTKLLRLRTKKSLDRLIARFGEQRGYLYFCALGSSLLAKGLIHAAPPPSICRSC